MPANLPEETVNTTGLQEVKEAADKGLVHSVLEYSGSVWDPLTTTLFARSFRRRFFTNHHTVKHHHTSIISS